MGYSQGAGKVSLPEGRLNYIHLLFLGPLEIFAQSLLYYLTPIAKDQARIDQAPAELLPTIPPIVARLEVDTSTGKNSPCGFKNRFNSSRTIPGSTMHLFELGSKSKTLFRYLLLSITIELFTVCPFCEVPPPLAKTDSPFF